MEKKGKILMLVIAIVVIAVPSTYFGIQFLVQSEINNAEVDIENIELLGLSDDQMIADVEFDIITTSPVSVSFIVQDIDIKYENAILGNVSLSKAEFTTSDTVYQTTTTINITNSALYNQLIEDFINQTSLMLTIAGTVEFTGALSGLLPQNFSKDVSVDGLDNLSPAIQAIEFENATGKTLALEFVANLNNPSQLTANLSKIWIDIYYEGNYYIGNASVSDVVFNAGDNLVYLDAEIGGNNTLTKKILSNYIQGLNSSLTLMANITMNFEGGTETYEILYNFEYDFEGTGTELVTVDDIDISIQVDFTGTILTSITDADVEITTNITVHNPMSFNINITFFDGEAYFDDNDLSAILLVSYPADDDIYIDNVTITDTVELPGSGTQNEDAIINLSNNLEMGIRLYDECLIDDELYIDIIDAIMKVQIGEFEITLTGIDLLGIYVPPSSFSYTET